MGAGVGGLALAAAVAPRAVTSLGLGGDRGIVIIRVGYVEELCRC